MPFTDVICPHHVKTVWVRPDAQIETTIERTLVFLSVPEAGAVRDVVPMSPYDSSVLYQSNDARELVRKTSGKTAYVYWTPRQNVTPYALYAHQLGWRVPAPTRDGAIYTDVSCEVRTGVLGMQLIAPATFETAVVFKHPRWRSLSTDRQLIKHAIKQLGGGGTKPSIVENGSRVEWSQPAPRPNERYICVAFHPGGVALWQKRLAEKSFKSRLRRLVRLESN